MEVTFTHQEGVTIVRVAHSGVSPREAMATAYGWQRYLSRLGMVAVGRDPGPEPWVEGTPGPR